MRFLIIGHNVLDFIKENGSIKVQPGGIVYTVLGLLSQIQDSDEIYLLTTEDDETKVKFSPFYQTINREMIRTVKKIPRVHLTSSEAGERCESYENITDFLSLSLLKDINRFDGIIINMITGFDIRLEDFENLRADFSGLIYFDVHTLSRGLDEKGNRNFRLIPQIERWLSCIDILQANENEIKAFSVFENESATAQFILNSGPELFIVTKGNKGATVYKKANETIVRIDRASLPVNAVNRIGCGDVFGSVFFYNYLSQSDLDESLDLAIRAAGISTTYPGISEFKGLRNDIN